MGILALTADERVADVKFTKDSLSIALRNGRDRDDLRAEKAGPFWRERCKHLVQY